MGVYCEYVEYVEYVYIQWGYQSTLQKIKHYLRYEITENENKVLSYCDTLRCMQMFMYKHD